MVKRFHKSGRHGFYVRVLREGVVAAGDAITIEPTKNERMTVAEAVRLYSA
jgi:MOSC domain-containing protein YiiM